MVNQVFMQGLLAALAAGLVTGIGGFMIFLKRRYLKTEINQLLNLAAGVMLAASFFSLLVPSMHEIVRDSRNIYSGALGYVLTVFAGVLLVWILNLLIPHEHNSMGHHGPHFDLKKAWLFIIAITLHKLPEGLAVGVAYGAEDIISPLSLVVGIAAHNIPEGLTIAISLVAAGNSAGGVDCVGYRTGSAVGRDCRFAADGHQFQHCAVRHGIGRRYAAVCGD